ncbi:hypothetical protein [Aquimarina sp. I32.4]|uniref:hypothetical protein n=1 Tax=Aquimarina sp. I32.4 TaxID=2053903 RepID=UPI000CDEBCCE|nr:hypothetical protein [Aquimarina sp. I32.4]
MEKKYKLSISDYSKIVLKIVILISCFLLLGIVFVVLLEMNIISLKSTRLEIIIPVFVVLMFVPTLMVVKTTFVIDELWLNEDTMESQKTGKINYKDIVKCSTITVRGGTSYSMTLNNGKKIALGSANQHSSESNKVFFDFIEMFEKKWKD